MDGEMHQTIKGVLMATLKLTSIPEALYWENPPSRWNIEDNQVLTIKTGKQTDLFTDPQGAMTVNNSPRLLFRPAKGSFMLSALVKVEFASTYDAGVLMVYANEKRWAKLCFEFSSQRHPMIVMVMW